MGKVILVSGGLTSYNLLLMAVAEVKSERPGSIPIRGFKIKIVIKVKHLHAEPCSSCDH